MVARGIAHRCGNNTLIRLNMPIRHDHCMAGQATSWRCCYALCAALSPAPELCPLVGRSARISLPPPQGERTPSGRFAWRCRTTALFLKDLSILGTRELLPVGDLHHVHIELQPVSIRVQEVEGPAPTAPKSVPRAAPALRPMDERPLDNLNALSTQIRQGLQPLVSISHLQRDVLEGVVAGITVFLGDGGRM